MEFDASPGLGGVTDQDGAPSRYFAQDLTLEDIPKNQIEVGDCKCPVVVENLAILIGVRLWLPAGKFQRAVVTIRTDSMAAVGSWSKERLSTPAINAIVREVALDQAEGLYEIDFVWHVAGVANDIADALSLLSEPEADKHIPYCLH